MDKKTIIMCYSYTGRTKNVCEQIAKATGFELEFIEEIKKRSTFSAYVIGGFMSMKRKPSKIKPCKTDFSGYDNIIIASGIWASNLPPAMIAFLKKSDLKGKNITTLFTSSGPPDTIKEPVLKTLSEYGAAKITFRAYKDLPIALDEFTKGD